MHERERFDVAIVGYGPVGGALANLLGQAGLSVVVLEREAAIYPLPRAIHFDGEVMRVFHSMGLKAAVEGVARPGLKGMHFVNAEGRTMLVRGGTAARGPHGCASNYYFHQPELERVLREGAQRFPNVVVRLCHDALEIDAGRDGATITAQDTANGTRDTFDAAYVVGCDGARSLVRRVMGTPMQDLGLHQAWLVFDVLLKRDLALPDHTVQHCDPARPMTYCNVTGRRRRWEIMLMPGDDPAAIVRPENVWPLVSRWITPDDAELERAVVYTFHSVIAQGWRRGRLILAGDAAHQTPPFLGQGMCAGIRDASNLAWKLVRVVRGLAPDSLLDSYESEREPHVRAFIELAVRLGDIIQTTDPAVAAERDRRFEGGEPEIFEYPTPMLGPGVHSGAAPAGTVFPQPELGDGRPLDAVTGDAFAVIGDRELLDGVSPDARERWRALDAVLVRDPGPAIGAWLAQRDARALILRPDRYIVGVAKDVTALECLTEHLPIAHVRAPAA